MTPKERVLGTIKALAAMDSTQLESICGDQQRSVFEIATARTLLVEREKGRENKFLKKYGIHSKSQRGK